MCRDSRAAKSLSPRRPPCDPTAKSHHTHKHTPQDPRLDFAAVLQRATRTTRLLQAIAAALLVAVAGCRLGWLHHRPGETVRALWAAVAGAWALLLKGGGGGGRGAAPVG